MPTIKKKTYVKPRTVERHEVTFEVPRIRVPKPFQGFVDFIRGYSVVALAIGIFLGASLKTVLDALTVSVINPVIGRLTDHFNLSNATVCIQHSDTICKTSIGYGSVLSAVISFILAAFMVYLIVWILRLDKFDKPKN